jgi:predicted ATP-grasp superfamily ATP-dependent carboligase
MNKRIAIFSGFNQRAVIAFIRTLERRHLDYDVIACSHEDAIFQTKYADKVAVTRKSIMLDKFDLLDCLARIQKRYSDEPCMIVPSTEALNRFLLMNRADFMRHGINIPLIEEPLYETISNKRSFTSLCKSRLIPIPEEYGSIAKTHLPFVAKPKTYISSKDKVLSPVIIKNECDLDDFLKKGDVEDYFYQEYIHGESLYLLYYFFKDGSYEKIVQKNLVQQPYGKSIIAAELIANENALIPVNFEKLFLELRFFGLVMVEVKKDGARCCAIEANPRFWGPSQLFVDAEYNLFDCFLYDNEIITEKPVFSPSRHKGAKYFWSGGLMQTVRAGLVPALHDGHEVFEREKRDFQQSEIYNRPDTKGIYHIENEI